MPRVHNWEEWDEVEERIQNEQAQHKTYVKTKSKVKKGKKNEESTVKDKSNTKHIN